MSAASKTKRGWCHLKKPPSTMFLGADLLTRDMESCRGIHGTLMDIRPTPFNPRVRTVPVCNVLNSSEAELKSYGLPALAQLDITPTPPPPGWTGGTGGLGRGKKAIAAANVYIQVPEFDPKKNDRMG